MTVFVVHEPVRWNGRRMVALDMSPAEKFGDLRVIFPGQDRPPPAQEAMPILQNAMCAFRPDDYLVIAGDMDLVVWAAALALKTTSGTLRLLKWDSRQRQYDVVESLPGYFT